MQTGVIAHFGPIAVRSANVKNERPEIDSSVVLGLLGFRSGDQFSDRSLVDASRNLYNLGAYRHVNVGLDSTATLTDSIVGVAVDLREDFLRQIDQDEGWATLDCFRLGAQYTNKNFLDRAERLELTTRLSKIGYADGTGFAREGICRTLNQDSVFSSKLNYYAGATVRRPTLFGGHWVSGVLGVYRASQRVEGLSPHDVCRSRRVGNAAARPRAPRASRVHARVRTNGSRAGVSLRGAVAMYGGGARGGRGQLPPRHLQRVDPEEHTRQSDRAEIRLCDRQRGSRRRNDHRIGSVAVVRENHNGRRRVSCGDGADGAVAAGAGRPHRRRRVVERGRLPPPQERLYAGGATSVRGFPQNELGTAGLSHGPGPIHRYSGFRYFLHRRAQARRAALSPGADGRKHIASCSMRKCDSGIHFSPDALAYVPFVDAGQVWVRSAASRGLNVKQLAVTPGLGIAYFSPIGPIQFNMGYNPNASPAGPAYFAAQVDSPGFGGGASSRLCHTVRNASRSVQRSRRQAVAKYGFMSGRVLAASFGHFLESSHEDRLDRYLILG